MKKCLFFVLLFICSVSTLLAANFTFDSIKNWTGEGRKKAALVIQWKDNSVIPSTFRPLVWGYRFEGQKTGEDMLRDIIKSDPRLYAVFMSTPMSTVMGGIGYDINNDANVGVAVDNKNLEVKDGIFGVTAYSDFDKAQPWDNTDYWFGGWASIGYCSYWSSDSKNDGAPNEFSYAMQGMSSLELYDGDWHAWTFSFLGSMDDNVPPILDLLSPAANNASANISITGNLNVEIYSESGNIIIKQPAFDYQNIQIYTASGSLILSKNIDRNDVIPFHESGFYYIRLSSLSQPQIIKKIHIK